MEKLYSRVRQFKLTGKLPSKKQINLVFSSFSKKEWFIFACLMAVLFVSTISILENINKSFMVGVPMRGGSLSEGIIGTPRFINPVLANSPADQDLVSLIYSGLYRKSQNKTLIPDLAEKYEVSKSNLTYTFTLKKNIYFQDGKPVTVNDIIFTVNKIKDPIIKSPHKANWDGVSVEKVDEKTVRFNLKQPYPSFLENMTLGIMPAYLWSKSPIELNTANTSPTGSGPYMIKNTSKQSSGIIDYFELAPFKKFVLGKPYIQNINLHFYSNEDDLVKALTSGVVDQISSITPQNAEILKEKKYKIYSFVLPRIFGLFFNQNQNQIFTDKTVIRAINMAIDKNKIVREVLKGYGIVIDSPIPVKMSIDNTLGELPDKTAREEILQKVNADLEKNGWKKGASGFLEKTIQTKKSVKNKSKSASGTKTTKILEFSISTGNAPELTKTAELIKQDLSAIGMKVDVKTFEIGNLNQGVIRPRKYDTLLFGQIINRESDLFAFWHSSQRKDPGLNVSMYTNSKIDKILEDTFTITDEEKRIKKYAQFEDEIKKDMPAVFLYSSSFIYVMSKNLQGFSIDRIISPEDRFLNVYSWYTEMEKVWKIFAQ